MKKKYFIIVLILLVAAIIYDPRPEFDSLKDRIIWNQISRSLADTNVSEVRVQIISSRQFTVNGEMKTRIINGIRESKFLWSNYNFDDPTPEIVVKITFKDGKEQNFGNWGTGEFETWNNYSQFTISNNELGRYIKLVEKELMGSK